MPNRDPVHASIKSNGQWYATTVTLYDADGNDMTLPVEGFTLSVAVNEPMRLTLAVLDGVAIDLECPVVKRSAEDDAPGFLRHPVTDISRAFDAEDEG